MTKAEALKKMEELREFIEECDKQPDVRLGQLWKYIDGEVFIVTYTDSNFVDNYNFNLIQLTKTSSGAVGNNWNKDKGFGSSREGFKYIGMAEELIKI